MFNLPSLVPALEGFALGGGLIIAIGAQNAFILRYGLMRQHVFILCLIASLSDALLILLGVLGIGSLVQAHPTFLFYVTLAGAAFLFCYGIFALQRMLRPQAMQATAEGVRQLRSAIMALLAFTFLNPHVYLDTVVLLGGVSGQHVGFARMAFAGGAMAASFVWFFSLGYGARWLTPFFAKPASWRVLDGLIALVMFSIAASLLQRALA